MLRDQARGELWRSERVAIDAFFFIFSQNKPSMASTCMVLLTILCIRRDVHDNSAATSFAHAPYVQHAGNTDARAQCIKISIPKRDGHTYIPTQNKMRSRISCLVLRCSAIPGYLFLAKKSFFSCPR